MVGKEDAGEVVGEKEGEDEKEDAGEMVGEVLVEEDEKESAGSALVLFSWRYWGALHACIYRTKTIISALHPHAILPFHTRIGKL